MAQSGCLPFGSLLTTVGRQSATRYRRGGLLSCGSQHNVISSPRLFRSSSSRQSSTCGGSRLGVLQPVAANLDLCKNQVSHGQSACRHMRIRQNVCTSRKGSSGMPRSSIQKPSKFCLCSSAVSSRTSLTLRSSRHLQAPLVGSLRASRSGAAYL